MKKLIIFPFSYRGKLEYILKNFIKEEEKTILIYSNFSKIKEVKKLYSNFLQKNLLPEILTIKTLACQLVEENSEKDIVDELERFTIILKIINKAGKLQDISIAGMGEGINNLIKDLKTSFEITPDYEIILKEINNYPWRFEKNKNDLLFAFNVIRTYENYLKEKNLIDIDDLYKEGEKYISQIKKERLIIENFYEILPSQKNFFSSLINYFPDVIFSFSYDENVSPDVKELILDKTLSFIKNITDWEIIKMETEENKSEVECYNFPSQDEEIKGIVKLISENFKKNKSLTIDDFSITCPDMLGYRDTIERIFNRYGIPSEMVPGYTLNNEPSIISLLDILIFIQTYDWKTLMGVLSSPYFKKINFEDFKKFSSYTRDNYEGIGFTKENFYKSNNTAVLLIKECVEIIKARENTLDNWVKNLLKIMEKLGWQPQNSEIERKFKEVLGYMKGDFSLTSSQFLNILKKCLEFKEIEESRGDGLRVSGVIESTGMEKKISFISGATEENIPNAPKLLEIFLPDKLKGKIGISDYKLRIARDRLDIHRLLNENEKVIFTYPSKIEGRNQMKSIFLMNFDEKTIYEKEINSSQTKIFNFGFSNEKFYEKYLKNGKIEIGVTSLEEFLKCKYRFYLKNVENIKPYIIPEIEEVPEIWGKMVHTIMENIFNIYKGKILSGKFIEDVVKQFKSQLFSEIKNYTNSEISEFYRDIMKIRAKEVVEKFKKIIVNHIGNKLLELEFEIPYEGPTYILKGKIDRIEENNDGLYIIDIKTGTSLPPSYTENDFEKNKNIQIPAYIWMFKNKFNLKKDVYGAIWNFSFKEDDKNKEEKKYNLTYIDRMDEYFNNIFDEIIKGKINFQPEENPSCFYCEFKTQCPK
ncbi:MAG TPA: PD-(D/E)XK nuclease family protein [bacterium]|nr:PD-(D/E)XK nuclease family protein [bacterium]